jgi:Xaa-Pro aminopeptidase
MTYGLINTEWANPVNYERMRNERLARARAAMAEHKIEALVCFTTDNMRYLSGIFGLHVPKPRQYCIVTLNHGPIFYAQGADVGRIKENVPGQDIRIAVPLHVASKQEILSWAVGLKRTFSELGVKGAKIGYHSVY